MPQTDKQPSRKPGFLACEALLTAPTNARPHPADEEFHRGRCVWITGAGGSIGGALARTIAMFQPAALVLLDAAEHGLFELDLWLSQAAPAVPRRLITGNCGDERLLCGLLLEAVPDLIYHAAAHKHVPLMEQNPFAAVANNALGTWRLAKTLGSSPAGRLLMISTDKAANPSSIMGTSKRIAEIALAACSHPDFPMNSVRLGNVLGTQGSVLATFQAQLLTGGPLTVTHPDAERYFLRMDCAVALILAAMRMASEGAIVAPVAAAGLRVLHLAEYLIAQHRTTEEEAVGITITGLRDGEKLRETFAGKSELAGAPLGDTLRSIETPAVYTDFSGTMRRLQRATEERDLEAMLQAVRLLVPDYVVSTLLNQQLHSTRGATHA